MTISVIVWLNSDGTVLAVGEITGHGTVDDSGMAYASCVSGSWQLKEARPSRTTPVSGERFRRWVSLSADGRSWPSARKEAIAATATIQARRVFEYASGCGSRWARTSVARRRICVCGGIERRRHDPCHQCVQCQRLQRRHNGPRMRVYQYTSGSWQPMGSDIDGKVASEGLGVGLGLSADGTVLAAGAPWTSPGLVRVYVWSGTEWVQSLPDIDGEAAGDAFGRVALSADGTRLAVGAALNDGGGNDAGTFASTSSPGTGPRHA